MARILSMGPFLSKMGLIQNENFIRLKLKKTNFFYQVLKVIIIKIPSIRHDFLNQLTFCWRIIGKPFIRIIQCTHGPNLSYISSVICFKSMKNVSSCSCAERRYNFIIHPYCEPISFVQSRYNEEPNHDQVWLQAEYPKFQGLK